MTRTRIIVVALAALALAAPAASADPHAIDSHNRALLDRQESAAQAELGARGRDGVETGSLAGTTDETTRALEQERAYSTYGEPAPIEQPAPAPAADGDDAPWALIGGFVGIAVLFGLAVLLVARPRRPRVAT